RECLENLFAALEDSFKKIISKMGITTAEGYRGARLFEAVGLGPELTDFLGNCPSRISGVGFADLVDDAQWRLRQAREKTHPRPVLGRNRDYHAFNARVRMALRKAAISGSLPLATEDEAGSASEGADEPKSDEGGEAAYLTPGGALTSDYQEFSKLVNARVPTVLRDLFTIEKSATPAPLDQIQPAIDLVRNHFRGAAMSHGALTRASHQDTAAALNELGGWSNSGEGGEARFRNDVPERAWGPFWEQVKADREADPETLCLHGERRKSRLRSRVR